jgi:hypothetical protein
MLPGRLQPRRGKKRNALATIGLGLGLALLLASPVASASLLVRVKPPYTGAATFAMNSTFTAVNPNVTNCANATLITPPTGYASNGSEFAASASNAYHVRNCTAEVTTRGGFFGPSFTPSVSGMRKVTYDWVVPWAIWGLGPSSDRNWVNVSVFGNLYDNTSGQWVLGGSSPLDVVTVVLNHSDFRLRSPLAGTAQNVTVTFSVGLTGGDQYLFYTGVYTQSFAATGSLAHGYYGHALAKVHAGVGNHPARVLSMTVS